ncbi:hypothetical protein C2E23DRAFT_710235, partial [Lenzites betulinus]
GSAFVGRVVPAYSHVVVAGLRYGASTAHQGRKHQYAYIRGREAMQIKYILQVSYTDARGRPLLANIAIVQPFIESELEQSMPWQSRAVDLGIGTWKAGRLGAPFVVELAQLTSHFALARVPHRTKMLWVTMSLCH